MEDISHKKDIYHMRFFNILENLKEQYNNDYVMRENGTILLAPDKIPRSRHMLFHPLEEKNVEEYLVSEYKNNFPKDYIEFLKYSNGANLYTVKMKTENFCFAHSMFVIFGLPLTPPFNRPIDLEEPFDVRIEDLARHKDIPRTWLKCATYIKEHNFDVTNDVFIDTMTNKVFACEKNKKDIVCSWENLDSCFCDIYNSLVDSKKEYEYNS